MIMTVAFAEEDNSFSANMGDVHVVAKAPIVLLEQRSTGVDITAIDAQGVKTATVLHGKDGKDGEDGYTPVKGVDYFDGRDGKDGREGVDGKDGADGYTPVKGKDYYTEADRAEMVSSVMAALPRETWKFVLADGTVVEKEVPLL